MSKALYRKYRPSRFEDLVGQNHIKITLQNELENKRVAHAYLFSGPRGVGKTTTARLLAKAVNCPEGQPAEPCGKCDFCREIGDGRSMDLIEIDAASHTGVDNVRENIIENSRFTPQRAKYKVFIIDEVHMLSISAFNALLKTLEEPPEHVIFILATTEIHRVPETIISRCQRFDFKRVSADELVKRMQLIAKAEKVRVEPGLLKTIARRAEGSVRDAEVLLGQVMSLGIEDITEENASLIIPRSNINLILEFFDSLIKRQGPAAISLINRLVDEGVNINDFTRELIDFCRRLMLLKITGSISELADLPLDEKKLKEITNQLESVPVSRLTEIIETIISKAKDFKYSQIFQLPLELAVLELCGGEGSAPANEKKSGDIFPAPAPEKEEKGKKPAVKKIADRGGAVKSAGYEKILEKWPSLIKELQQSNHSISLSLKVAAPLAVNGDILTVGFLYKFHAERFQNPKVRQAVGKALDKLVGRPLTLKTEIISEEEFRKFFPPEAEVKEGESVFEQALETFGGEVLEK